jgi:hypothetical protein
MKTLRLALSFIILVVFSCSNSLGQRIIRTEMVNHLDNYFFDGIGYISGTATYHLTIQLSKETGKIQKIHWVLGDCSLANENGEKVRIIDSGHDTYGTLWGFFNKPNYYCAEIWGSPELTYPDVEDGWLDGIMPAENPIEGTFVSMSFKYIFKGHPFSLSALVQIHINANGDVTAEVIKP